MRPPASLRLARMDLLAYDKRWVRHILCAGFLAIAAAMLGVVWAVFLFGVDVTHALRLALGEVYGIFMCMGMTIMTLDSDKNARCTAPVGRDQEALDLSIGAGGGICVPPHASLHV